MGFMVQVKVLGGVFLGIKLYDTDGALFYCLLPKRQKVLRKASTLFSFKKTRTPSGRFFVPRKLWVVRTDICEIVIARVVRQ